MFDINKLSVDSLLKCLENSTLLGYVITDKHLHLKYMNEFFKSLFDISDEKLLDTNFLDYLKSDFKYNDVGDIIKENKSGSTLKTVLTINNISKRVLISFSKVSDINYSHEYVLFSIMDESEKRKIHDELLHAQKMESIGLLAGGITHDFNNILGSISGYAELLKSYITKPELREMISVIEHESSKASKLISSLLQYARGDKSSKEQFSLLEIVQDTYLLLRKSISKNKNIDFHIEIPSDLPLLMGNPVQIQQCIINLCLNAKEAMPDGGTLTITAESCNDISDQMKEISPQWVKIKVLDTGIGIKNELKQFIFQPFFTTNHKPDSTGLGLYMVKRIIEDHHGTIDIMDNTPHGAIFTLLLPAVKRLRKSKPGKSEGITIDGQGKLIHVIDDEESIVLLMKQFLEQLNFKVVVSHNGKEGLETFNFRREEIELIFLDYMMPTMNGEEVLDEIKKIDPQLPVLLFTGVDDDEIVEKFINKGIAGVIKKPFSAQEIIVKLKTILELEEAE